MPVGSVSLDPCDTVIEANSYFTNIFGRGGESVLGKSIFYCMPGESAEILKDVIDSFKSDLKDETRTFQQIVDGMHFQITAQPIFAKQSYAGAVMNITDVSVLTENSERDNEAKEQLFAKMSYEIRTSVSGIIGFAELLRKEKLEPEHAEFVDMICTSSENLLDSLDEISVKADIKASLLPDKTPMGPEYGSQADADEPMGMPADRGELPHVLLVDDMANNNMLNKTILERAGYRTTSCESGEEAVSLAGNEKFDVILMDIQMPGIGGIEATKIIKSSGLNSKTPVIAITAGAGRKNKLNCLENGCDDYIFKPAKSELLLKKLSRFIRQKEHFENAARGDGITSSLAGNPDYHKMIDVFVSDLPKQIKQMQEDLEENNLQELCLNIQSLKELSGFAGFPIYTEKSSDIEQMLHDNQIDKVAGQLDELAKLCLRTKSVCT